ncbi:transcription factor Opi1-domain-containing protein [Pilobolus umbonatus]|nr:transcription factor Opi1-domain-containing protein [Pilobolus umbonatus]
MSQSAMSINSICHQSDEEISFIRRLPLMDTALKAAYESSVVKYGAEMIESYTTPIYDKLYKSKESIEEDTLAATSALARASLHDTDPIVRQRKRNMDEQEERKTKSPCSRSTSPHPYSIQRPKSRWQQIVLHAGSAAGTTAAVISEESMKCLRYCLHWIQYGIQHIEHQMNLLRSFLVSLATTGSSTNDSTLIAIKKEIVDTLRKVVEVVSKYAGTGLPEQAKLSVRAFILHLPTRWAIMNASSPIHETSITLLDFSGESIDMLRSVSVVFSDTIERAELWLKRLKVNHTHPLK